MRSRQLVTTVRYRSQELFKSASLKNGTTDLFRLDEIYVTLVIRVGYATHTQQKCVRREIDERLSGCEPRHLHFA